MPQRIDVDRVIELVAEGAILFDALPESIYRQEHLPGAASLPLETFEPSAVADIDRAQPVITYCFDQHCDLSSRTARRLEHEGFSEVYDLIGGRAAWTALGLPTEGSVADSRRISQYLEQPRTVAVDATIGDVAEGEQPIAVVDDDGVLLGSLDPIALELPADTPVTQAMTPAPGTIRPELRVEDVAKRLADDGLDHVFVTAVNGTLFGVVMTDGLHV